MRALLRYRFYLIIALFITLFAVDAFSQYYGTGRRVARRTARRTSRRVNYRYNGGGYGYYGGAAPAPVTTLPGGCMLRAISGINYQYCSGVYYRPYYEGDQVVYVVENPE